MNQDAAQQDAVRKDAVHQDAEHRDVTHQEAERPRAAHRHAVRRAAKQATPSTAVTSGNVTSEAAYQTAQEIAELLPAVVVNLRAAALFDAAGADLTANQLVTLLMIGHSEGGRLRAGEVARRLSISAASATALVDRLVETGVLTRTRGADRRAVWICVTDAGRDLIERLKSGAVDRIAEILVKVRPPSPDALVESLRQVANFANQITDGDPAP